MDSNLDHDKIIMIKERKKDKKIIFLSSEQTYIDKIQTCISKSNCKKGIPSSETTIWDDELD